MKEELLQRIGNYNWKWNGVDTPLKSLHYKQLNIIKQYVRKHRKNFYGISSADWFNGINYLIKNTNTLQHQREMQVRSIVDKSTTKLFKAVFPKQMTYKPYTTKHETRK